jgi:hypothetical protein
MHTPILGSSYVARSVNAADARMVNLFPEAIPEGGKEPGFLNRAPGLRLLANMGDGPIRGLWQFGGYGYAVSGETLYKIDTLWNTTVIGTVAGSSGPVSISDNGTQMFVACDGPSFIYNSLTLEFKQIDDPDFPGAVTVGYINGYFVFNEPNSQRIWITELLDGQSIDPLDFASAEGSPDGLVSVLVDHREVWLFGTNSVEVWYDSGGADFPLTPVQGAFNEVGCIAPYSVAKLDNGIFWLGADARGKGIVYRANGYTAQRVSTHAVEWQIQQYGNLSDAVAYTYQQDGHSFYVLIFPSANTTWVFDVATSMWHERAAFINGSFTRHRSNCQMSFNNEIVVGDHELGNIYAFDLEVFSDAGAVQKWLRSWRALPTGMNDLKRSAHHSLQLDAETGAIDDSVTTPIVILDISDPNDDLLAENGDFLVWEYISGTFNEVLLTESGDQLVQEDGGEIVLVVVPISATGGKILVEKGLPTATAIDPQVMLRWSDDGGHTWSNSHWRSMGKTGTYGTRVIWRRLGMTLKLRDRVYEVSGTDPIKIAIMGAELIASPTNG